jgi:asparagine synthetase B (glutamine-hydrolysing)
MCEIAEFRNLKGLILPDPSASVAHMGEAMRLRGPDDQGGWI